ncbi:MAG: transketolase family protein [Actinobacteria bacterium]|nr:transketolase family protein [Actinomycetota bacterium]
MEVRAYHLKRDEQYRGLDIPKKRTLEGLRDALLELGHENPNVVVLTADLKYPTLVDKFAEEFPDRFVDVGVAEQNMMGIAAGLAACGKICFATTFAVFATTRACEQVRTDIAYPGLNVKIVGTAGGFSFGMGGVTHASTEDVAIMRNLPNMTVLAPADYLEAKLAVKAAALHGGPVYLRLGRSAEPIINKDSYNFEIGKAVKLREGKDITIFAYGSMVFEALRSADELIKDGIEARIINIHTIKPLDTEMVLDCARMTKAIITVEEHTLIGGLGSAVAQTLLEHSHRLRYRIPPFLSMGLADIFATEGNPDELRELYGLNAKAIAQKARILLEENR